MIKRNSGDIGGVIGGRVSAALLLSAVLAAGLAGCAGGGRTPGERGPSEPQPEHYTRQAEVYRQVGRVDEAMRLFQKALERDPNQTGAHIGIGDVHQERGDLEDALTSYQAARRSDPSNFEANYKLGLTYQLMDRARQAIDAYLSALTIEPDDFEANLNLASAYLQLNQPGVALPYAEKAVELNGDSQEAQANLGAIQAALGNHEEAVLAYRRAADLGKLSPPVAVNLVNSLIKLERYQRAINTLDVLIRSEGRADYYERLGYARFKLGQFERSEDAYRRALEMDGQNVRALNGLGVNLMLRYLKGGRQPGDKDLRNMALKAWRKSIRVDGSQERIVDLISRYGS